MKDKVEHRQIKWQITIARKKLKQLESQEPRDLVQIRELQSTIRDHRKCLESLVAHQR